MNDYTKIGSFKAQDLKESRGNSNPARGRAGRKAEFRSMKRKFYRLLDKVDFAD